MKFPFLFKSPETAAAATSSTASWPWPSCATNPKTLSFRANPNDDIIHKTINSAYDLDDKNNTDISADHTHYDDEEIISCKSVISIRGLRSERFFFEPGKSNSILEEAKPNGASHYKNGAAVLEIDSRDPILDFRVSMAEMVEAHGLEDWGNLEKLLACYLRVNGESNHGYVIGAFVDLIFHLAFGDSDFSDGSSCSSGGGAAASMDENCCSSVITTTATQYSLTSPLSFSSSSSTYSSSASLCLLSNCMENEDEIVVEKNGGRSPSSYLSNASSSSCV